jgi:putative redox protein
MHQKDMSIKTTTTWKTGQKFESTQRNAMIELDAEAGFSPKALLLTGLAGCTGVDVVEILEKMRVPFSDLAIDAEADQTDSPPKVFKTIHLTYSIKIEEELRDKVKKAIDLSLEKYCGVAAMLKKNSPIEYEIIIRQ